MKFSRLQLMVVAIAGLWILVKHGKAITAVPEKFNITSIHPPYSSLVGDNTELQVGAPR
jgi:hypothetical protein